MPIRRASKINPCPAPGAAAPTVRTTSPMPITEIRTILLAGKGAPPGTKIAYHRQLRHGAGGDRSPSGGGRSALERDGDRRPLAQDAGQVDGPAPALDQPPGDRQPQA